MSKNRAPVASFNPAWVAVWRDASVKEIRLDMPSLGKAITERHKLYRLRNAMEREKHPDAKAAVRAKIGIEVNWKDGRTTWYNRGVAADLEPNVASCTMVLGPNNASDIDDALAAAGYAAPEAPILD